MDEDGEGKEGYGEVDVAHVADSKELGHFVVGVGKNKEKKTKVC